MIVVFQGIDRLWEEVIQFTFRSPITNQIINGEDRILIIKLHGLVTRSGTQIRRRLGTDRGEERLVPVVPGDGTVSDRNIGVFLIKLRDEGLAGIDVFGPSPDHVPELQVDVVFGLDGQGNSEKLTEVTTVEASRQATGERDFGAFMVRAAREGRSI